MLTDALRKAKARGAKLYGPFTDSGSLRGAIQVLQKIFKFRTCPLDIQEDDPKWRWFRPCLLASINQCSAPCNLRISKEDYRSRVCGQLPELACNTNAEPKDAGERG